MLFYDVETLMQHYGIPHQTRFAAYATNKLMLRELAGLKVFTQRLGYFIRMIAYAALITLLVKVVVDVVVKVVVAWHQFQPFSAVLLSGSDSIATNNPAEAHLRVTEK